MNERIKELAKVAEYWANTFEDKSRYQEYLMETFADSIVWECMKICEDVMKKDNSALGCWSEIKRTFRS
jgi:hypothetical protein